MAKIDLDTFNRWMRQIQDQPPWRARADREADYYDGNQLDAKVLRRQRELGIPPAIEPMIQPTINTILGLEVKQRPDWKVVPDDDEEDDAVAEALNHKLNRAERHAGALPGTVAERTGADGGNVPALFDQPGGQGMKDEPRMSEGEAVCTGFAIGGYAFAVALGRLLVFDALPRLPETFWNDVYWCLAGAGFVMMLRKIRQFWGRE